MPILPEGESRRVRPSARPPSPRARLRIKAAGLSFTDPEGFIHSALAKTSTPEGRAAVNRSRRIKGVPPTRLRRLEGIGETRSVVVSIAIIGPRESSRPANRGKRLAPHERGASVRERGVARWLAG